MRRTRLVILPGARCLTQMCCLLLYLSCPNIGALCRERLDMSREDLYSQTYLDIEGCADLNKEGDEMCYVAASRINCKTKYTGNHNESDQFIGTGTLNHEIKNSVQPVCQGKTCRENEQEIHFNSILNYGSSELQTRARDVGSVRKIRSSPATRQTTMNTRISRDNNELESSRISRVVRRISDDYSSRREEVSRRRENVRFALGRLEGQQSTRQVRLSREFNTNRVNDRRSIQHDNVLSNFRQREEESARRVTTSKENRRTDVRLENTRRFHETALKHVTTERDTGRRNEIVDTRRIVRENVVTQRTFAELRASRNNNPSSKRFDNRQRLAVHETQDSRQLFRQASRREEEFRRVSVVRLPEKQKTEIFDSRTELRRNSNEQIRRNVREIKSVNRESELTNQRRSAERVNQQRRIEGRFRDTARIREFSGRRFSEDQNRESREMQFRNQYINNANFVRYDTDYRRTTENTQNRRIVRENRNSDRVSARASLDSQRREFSPNRKTRDSNTVHISREETRNSDSRVNRRTLNRFDNIQNRRSEERSVQRITDTTNQVLRVSSERSSSQLSNRRTAVDVQQSSRQTESSRDNRDNERRASRLSSEFRRVSSDSRLDVTIERRNNLRNSNSIHNTRRTVSELSIVNVNNERASRLSSDIVGRRNLVERKNVRNNLAQSQRSNFNGDKREVLRTTERREEQRNNQFLTKRSSSEPDIRRTARQFDDRRSNRVERDTTRLLSERLQEYRSNKQFDSRRTSFEPSFRREKIQDNSRKISERVDNSRYNPEERLINRQNYRRNENRLSREPEIKRFSYERDIRRTSDRLEKRFDREDSVRRLASERTANGQRTNDLQSRTREIESRRILFAQIRQRNTEYTDVSPVRKVRTITDFRADRIDERRISKESQIRRSSENNALQSRRLDQRVNKEEKRINEENVLNRQTSDRVSSRRVFRKLTASENSIEYRVRRISRLDKRLSEQNERSLDRRISERRIRQVEGLREGSDRQRRLSERAMSSNVELKIRRFSNVRGEIPTSSLKRASSDDRHLQNGKEEIIRKQRSIIQNSELANRRRIVEEFRVRSLASEENARRNTREYSRVLIRDFTGVRLERTEHIMSSRRRDERLDKMKMLQRLSSRRSIEENESGRRFNRNELNSRRELQEVRSNHRRSDSLVDTGKLLHGSSRIRDIRYISLSNDDRRNNNQLAQQRFSRRIDNSAKLSDIKAREFISTDKVPSSKYIQDLSDTNNLIIVNVAEMSNSAANLAENATELGTDNKYLHLDGSSVHEYTNFDLPLSSRKINAVIPTDKAESETFPSKQKPISMVLQNLISAIWPLKEETRAALVGSVACILLTANVK